MRYENIVMLDEISSNGFRGNFPASMAEMYIRNLDGARDSFVQVFRLFDRKQRCCSFSLYSREGSHGNGFHAAAGACRGAG